MIKIFISHSSRDSVIAKLLAELFRNAMRMTKSEIRCTSVDGYRLPAGASTDEQLRREVLEAPVLVGILSHHSFESAYVLFELGARWGKNSYMAPVLAPGIDASIIKGPLSSINALNCENRSQIHQLIDEIASQIGIQPESASSYQEYVDAVVTYHPEPLSLGINSLPNIVPVQVDDEYSDAEEIIRIYCESQWGDDYKMQSHCIDKQRVAVEQLRYQTHTGVPNDIFLKIRKKAKQEWPDDFQMRLHTENQQLESYRKLHQKK